MGRMNSMKASQVSLENSGPLLRLSCHRKTLRSILTMMVDTRLSIVKNRGFSTDFRPYIGREWR